MIHRHNNIDYKVVNELTINSCEGCYFNHNKECFEVRFNCDNIILIKDDKVDDNKEVPDYSTNQIIS